MLSKVLVKLTGIFLILHISATSATPTAQPGEAQKINDDIHARVPSAPYYPYQCSRFYAWMRRECVRAVDPRAWQDVCGKSTYYTNWRTEYDNKPGSCPAGTYCLDSFNANNDRFIDCVSDKDKGKRKLDQLDPQIGVSDTKRAANQLSNTQFEYSVTLDHDMTGAAVAAVLRSDDNSFLITPNNVIVGNVRGEQQVVCKGDKSSPDKARECYPNGQYDFKKGDIIDYTWGMTSEQEGTLLYGIMP